MQTPESNSSYLFSSSYYQSLWENFASGHDGSSNPTKKSPKTRTRIVERQNGRCEICYQIAKKKLKGSFEPQNGKEEDNQQVVGENVVVIIDDNEEERNENLEKEMVGNGKVKGDKREAMKEKVVLAIEKDKADEEKRNILEEKIVENGEVEEGKFVIIDEGVDMEALLGDVENNVAEEGVEGNGNDGVMMTDFMENENGDMFSAHNIEEDDRFPTWNQVKFEAEQNWDCSYPFWEIDNSSLNFWDVEPSANDWVVSLWQF
ncbi:hypothetical protein RIF29_19137 [Crotalaria pallida]|uniref:Uncharacterized protein n=1 Tax=Crotalaria pallida TaxID=3830 RepID=A0AAN9F7A5_CROPI